ncbi:hypothetical protein IJJ05_02775 [Candidatus Saccharibacteria bacterium]|nr:hypothetical protein [Candidatus Saccharibacteria bacterium]
MEYFEKIEKAPQDDLSWNIPEQKRGMVNIIGGNGQNFRTEIKISEFLAEKYPIQTVKTILPDVLKTKLPPLPNLVFLKSTDSGSFADEEELKQELNVVDFNLLIGDLSKNTVTGRAISSACRFSEKPTLITRDSIDLVIENEPEKLLMNEKLIFFGSMTQMQKLLRAVYYPKMLLLSQSLIQVVEILHKFTLSYPIAIITLHNGQILIAKNGEVKAVPIDVSGYSPIMFWQGELAAKIVALNLFNLNNLTKATVAAIFNTI